jgi:hypothetical protein
VSEKPGICRAFFLTTRKVKNSIRTAANAHYLAEQTFTDTGYGAKDSRANGLTVLLHSAALAVRDTKHKVAN